jgi:hypothetical protein
VRLDTCAQLILQLALSLRGKRIRHHRIRHLVQRDGRFQKIAEFLEFRELLNAGFNRSLPTPNRIQARFQDLVVIVVIGVIVTDEFCHRPFFASLT